MTRIRSPRTGRSAPRPIVFVGPSLPHDRAREILEADYRLPIRRGDLDGITSGAVVAIIDGVFDQYLAVSPSEIRVAIGRGVRIFGASSMGALRAAEVPGVVGVGRVHEMYRDGTIDSDDEVAVTFDAETLQPLCEPLVNVRHAVERLATPGTISRDLAAAIVSAARKLPYFERTYPRILEEAGVAKRQDASHLASMFASYNLKREDAITLLEQLRGLSVDGGGGPAPAAERALPGVWTRPPSSDSVVHLWEFGHPIEFREVVAFLALTGTLGGYARRALARLGPSEAEVQVDPASGPAPETVRDRLLAQTARAWHWATEEEVDISLGDLGLGQTTLATTLAEEVEADRRAMALTRGRSAPFLEALRMELFLDDLALKRETARALSLPWLAARGEKVSRRLSAAEKQASTKKLCQILDVRDAGIAMEHLGWWGIRPEEVQAFIAQLGFARRAVGEVRRAAPLAVRRKPSWLRSSPKAPGSRRFCATLSQAHSVVKRLQPLVGVTRVAMITALGTVGIPTAQAFRPDGEWSSTVGSGKSESTVGAKVGAVMEEVEKWAQEEFARRGPELDEVVASFRALERRGRCALDPSTLDLPYDSCYTPDLGIGWRSCADLAGGAPLLVPTAALTHRRVPDDIYYSSRGGRKTVTTNGLASGLTTAEALTHALCEFIERHARAVDFIVNGNPGGPVFVRRPAVDLKTVPRSTRRLLHKITRAGYHLRVWDIRSDVLVPTFCATILLPEGSIEGRLFGDGWQRASGWAAHPDPETALNMAVLEASQTIMSHVAGAREDLTLQARSLGRHERTDASRRASFAAELDVDAPRCAFPAIDGFVSRDAAQDVRWVVARLQEAGCRRVLVADYSTYRIRPVRVVRAIVPGLETINPFHTGARARMALLSDVLPTQ